MTRVAVLGASGSVGGRIVDRLLGHGHEVTAQSRSAERLAGLRDRARVVAFDPVAPDAYPDFLAGAEAVVFALGNRSLGPTTFFSDTTRALLAAMPAAGVRRLVAITGVGAGETRGHGGVLYNRVTFPLLTARVYADKDRQERLIGDSGLDWTIVRPAPFRNARPEGRLRTETEVAPDLQLTGITRDEVAAFVVAEIERPRYLHRKPFIGHA